MPLQVVTTVTSLIAFVILYTYYWFGMVTDRFISEKLSRGYI